MFEAQLLIAKETAYSVFSPWFPRGGESVIATLDVVAVDGAANLLTVELYSKNSEQSGDGQDAEASTSIGSDATPGRKAATWDANDSSNPADILELVRYKFTISDSAGKWVLFRMLPPVWFDAVKGA